MRMPLTDESDLGWFLGQGEGNFMRSTTGPMLERAKVMSASYTYDDLSNRMSDKYDRRAPDIPDRDFKVAHGAMMQDITAMPSGKQPVDVTPEGHVRIGNDPDHCVVIRYASVSRRLSRVDAYSVDAGKYLRVYYGDSGARWGRSKHGRIFSLYALTPAGSKLVAKVESEDPGVDFLPADERLGVIAALQGIPSAMKMSRKRALDMADTQAWAMYRAACLVWLGVVNGRST